MVRNGRPTGSTGSTSPQAVSGLMAPVNGTNHVRLRLSRPSDPCATPASTPESTSAPLGQPDRRCRGRPGVGAGWPADTAARSDRAFGRHDDELFAHEFDGRAAGHARPAGPGHRLCRLVRPCDRARTSISRSASAAVRVNPLTARLVSRLWVFGGPQLAAVQGAAEADLFDDTTSGRSLRTADTLRLSRRPQLVGRQR
jgi:hypothetical protein